MARSGFYEASIKKNKTNLNALFSFAKTWGKAHLAWFKVNLQSWNKLQKKQKQSFWN